MQASVTTGQTQALDKSAYLHRGLCGPRQACIDATGNALKYLRRMAFFERMNRAYRMTTIS